MQIGVPAAISQLPAIRLAPPGIGLEPNQIDPITKLHAIRELMHWGNIPEGNAGPMLRVAFSPSALFRQDAAGKLLGANPALPFCLKLIEANKYTDNRPISTTPVTPYEAGAIQNALTLTLIIGGLGTFASNNIMELLNTHEAVEHMPRSRCPYEEISPFLLGSRLIAHGIDLFLSGDFGEIDLARASGITSVFIPPFSNEIVYDSKSMHHGPLILGFDYDQTLSDGQNERVTITSPGTLNQARHNEISNRLTPHGYGPLQRFAGLFAMYRNIFPTGEEVQSKLGPNLLPPIMNMLITARGTDGSARMETTLREWGLYDCFDGIICRDGQSKLEPTNSLGVTLHFDDSTSTVEGLLNAGLPAALVIPNGGLEKARKWHIARTARMAPQK